MDPPLRWRNGYINSVSSQHDIILSASRHTPGIMVSHNMILAAAVILFIPIVKW